MYRQSMGQMPTLQDLQSLYEVDESSGLKVIDYSYKSQVVAVLNKLNFQATSPIGPTIFGVAAYVLASSGQTWVNEFVHNGYMVMIDLMTVTTGALNVIATKEPHVIASQAGPDGKYVMIDGPPALATQAQQLIQSGQVSSNVCPPGTAPGADGKCYEIPGGVTDQPANGGGNSGDGQQQVPPAQTVKKSGADAPSWLLPILFVGGGIAVVAIAIVAKNKQSTRY